MKFKITISVLVISLSVPTWSFSGPSTGGGGFALSCMEDTRISRVELLDLYEGRNVLGFQMATASGNLVNDYASGADRTYTLQGYPNLAEDLHPLIVNNLKKFMQNIKFVLTKEDLPTATDLGELPLISSRCRVEQVAYYDDQSSTVYILKPLWDMMDSLSQAALVHHELWYREQRRSGEQTSENTRHSVAQIFSVTGPVPLDEGLPTNTSHFSSQLILNANANTNSKISLFFAAKFTKSGLTRLQFSQLNGIAQLSKTWVDFPLMTWDFKLGRSVENPNVVSCILQTPNVNYQYSAALNGISVKGYSVLIRARSMEPVKMIVLKNGTPISEGYLAGGINCSEYLH